MITSALPYANGLKHVGHLAGAYIPADIYVRYLRAQKRDVVFVCGSDEHGTAIPIQAKKENTTPQAIIDKYHEAIKRSGKLDRLAGLVIGRFTDMKDTDRPFGMPVYDIIWELIKEYDYPVCFEFPVSHSNENYALKVGVEYKLKVSKNKVMLEE